MTANHETPNKMKLSVNKVGCWAGILLLIALANGCSCKRRAARLVPVQDKLQSYVIIGRNDPAKCPLPWRDKALLTDRQAIVKFWVRSVFRDALLTPEPLKVLHYDVVNE